MVVTTLGAQVRKDKWRVLRDVYERETARIPDNIHQSFLLQSHDNHELWQILTVWRSQQDLDLVRQKVGVHLAVEVFQAAEAKPILGVWRVEIARVNEAGPVPSSARQDTPHLESKLQ